MRIVFQSITRRWQIWNKKTRERSYAFVRGEQAILWIEEILHHLGWLIPHKVVPPELQIGSNPIN